MLCSTCGHLSVVSTRSFGMHAVRAIHKPFTEAQSRVQDVPKKASTWGHPCTECVGIRAIVCTEKPVTFFTSEWEVNGDTLKAIACGHQQPVNSITDVDGVWGLRVHTSQSASISLCKCMPSMHRLVRVVTCCSVCSASRQAGRLGLIGHTPL